MIGAWQMREVEGIAMEGGRVEENGRAEGGIVMEEGWRKMEGRRAG